MRVFDKTAEPPRETGVRSPFSHFMLHGLWDILVGDAV